MPKRRETKRRVRRRKGARTHNAKSPDAEWEPRDALGKGQSGGVDELLDLLAESPISRREPHLPNSSPGLLQLNSPWRA